uniref:protein FAM216A-like isoform X2 n=1 Tax=Scatophagus argus TaxID=75038 RepID=UPI001ED827C9|nr:protein FAM216A-like isoform X2 [Scatophagus argus]
MKKQVTFAESQVVHRLHQDEAFPRGAGTNGTNMAVVKESRHRHASINFSNGLNIARPPATRCEPQLQHVTTVRIPQSVTAAPFLKHAALTPAQKEFLRTIAVSHSSALVRSLITQHYMNVLHRCTRAGDLAGTSGASPGTDAGHKHQSEVREKINTAARNPGKSFLPKIPNRPANQSASTQRKTKTRATTSASARRKRARRSRIKLLEEEEEEEEEGPDDSLTECVRSLSVGDWDEDAFLDL